LYTNLENSPPQYRAICGILSCLDLTHPDAPVAIKPETQVLLDGFSEADWDLFFRMAKAEGVAPLMYHAMTRSAFRAPEATRLKLQSVYYETAAFNQVLLTEMERVVQALNDAGIPVIVLKGAALAWTVYPDPALRPMNDLDLLVKTEDLERAKELIFSLGYHEPIPEMARGINRMTGHAYYLVKNNREGMIIELHWNLVSGDYDSRTPSIDWVWNNKLLLESNHSKNNIPIDVSTLLPELLLIYLIGHLVLQHGKSTSRLIWLYEIYFLFISLDKEINWEQFTKEIESFGWLPALQFSNKLIIDHFAKTLPEEMIFEISKYSDGNEDPTIHIIWEGKQDNRNIYYANLLTTQGMKRIRLLMANFFPDEKYMRWRYRYNRRWQGFYFYPYRWWSMIARKSRN
jgi:hypothetical protein